MAITLRASWGISSQQNAATGVVSDVSQGGEPILAPLHDELGRVIGQAHYDTHFTGEVTLLVKAGVNTPKKGEQITIGDTKGYVTNVRLMESNQQYTRLAVSIEAYSQCDETTAVNAQETANTDIGNVNT